MTIKFTLREGVELSRDVETTEDIETFLTYCKELKDWLGWGLADAKRINVNGIKNVGPRRVSEPATQAQLDYMAKLGIEPYEGITKKDAWRIINEYK